jgi:hypothetical protein
MLIEYGVVLILFVKWWCLRLMMMKGSSNGGFWFWYGLMVMIGRDYCVVIVVKNGDWF